MNTYRKRIQLESTYRRDLHEMLRPFAKKVVFLDTFSLLELLFKQFEMRTPAIGVGTYDKVIIYLKEKVIPHKIAVYEAGMSLLDLIKPDSEMSSVFSRDELRWNLETHDLSKFTFVESIPYAMHNFNSKAIDPLFERAWHHHKMNNPHHPEYWLNPNKSGVVEPLPMPMLYVIEMVADWIGAGITYGNPLENWLPGNLHLFCFHPETIDCLEAVLALKNIVCYRENDNLFFDKILK